MGGALLRRWLATGLEAGRVTVIDPAPPSLDGVRWQATPPDGSPSLLVLGVKPQILAEAAAMLAPAIGQSTVIVSILAGIECDALARAFPDAGAIVRAMPNLPVALGKGVTGLFSHAGEQAEVSALFAPTGHCEWVDDEQLFHAITALSGSGPAFVYRFIAALAEGGEAAGLSSDRALGLAGAMVEGAAALCRESGVSPLELARRVTSPNGTTAAGLARLDDGQAFAAATRESIEAAANRSRELGRAN
jgi:pyrroline-5-carboxylate reductase